MDCIPASQVPQGLSALAIFFLIATFTLFSEIRPEIR
jgi:hypothetical protein